LYVSVLPGLERVEVDGVRVLPRGESWNQDLQDELRGRFERVQRGEKEREAGWELD
jgi:hypothetical protein